MMATVTNDVSGIQHGAVSQWIASKVPEAQPPFTFTLIAGGHSNLTFRVVDASGASWILRRPPLGELMPTAHDVRREYRAISALANTEVPVPRAYGYCDDISVTGAPFYLMGCVQGQVLHDKETAENYLDLAARGVASEALIDTLVAFQNIDFEAAGLGDLGRKDGYIARQLKRFGKMYELCSPDDPEPLNIVRDQLIARLPEQTEATLVHGDLRLGNCICAPSGKIVAVLDWETCTLGDPLADISLLIALWGHPSASEPDMPTAPSMAPGFWSQEQLLDAYAKRSGRDLSQMNYYIAFQYWRMAVIWEEINARHKSGAYGEAQDMPEASANAASFAKLAATRLDGNG